MLGEFNDYHDYLQSHEWKRTRDRRVLMDKKCQICGRPFDLQVHHMTYRNIYHEHPGDLITVCKNCHRRIEEKKSKPSGDSFGIVNNEIARQFCKDYENRDYSHMGDLDLCKREVIYENFLPYLKAHGGGQEYINGHNIIQAYFRNRRYEIILRFFENGAPASIVKHQTKFSSSMIDKVYKDPEQAKRQIEEEKS